MKTVLKSNYYEFEIEKSKFLSYLIHIESEEEAKNEVAKIKKEHPKATEEKGRLYRPKQFRMSTD